MSTAIQQFNVDDIWRMAQFIAKPGMFGIKNPEQAMALMLVAQAEGRHPATVAMEYDLISGKPALKAKAKLARFQQAGGIINWIERSDAVAAAEFSHPSSPKPLMVRWDMERAKAAGLTGKDTWRKFPAQMLSARVISEGVDAVFPSCGGLMHVTEEVQDFDDKPRREEVKQAEIMQDFRQPLSAKEAAAEFGRVIPPPTDPEAVALDAAINGRQDAQEPAGASAEPEQAPEVKKPSPRGLKPDSPLTCGFENKKPIRKKVVDMSDAELDKARELACENLDNPKWAARATGAIALIDEEIAVRTLDREAVDAAEGVDA